MAHTWNYRYYGGCAVRYYLVVAPSNYLLGAWVPRAALTTGSLTIMDALTQNSATDTCLRQSGSLVKLVLGVCLNRRGTPHIDGSYCGNIPDAARWRYPANWLSTFIIPRTRRIPSLQRNYYATRILL